MKKHVSNLELSRKLKELKVKQASEFYWYKGGYSPTPGKWVIIDVPTENPETGNCFSAFLASEIAESLPRGVEIETSKAYIHGSDISRWRCVLTYMNKKKIKMPMGFSETLVDALAEMKIYLLEHGLMEVGR